MRITSLVLLFFILTLPITLAVEGWGLIALGLIGSLCYARFFSRQSHFWISWSRFQLSYLGFATVCLTRVDPYAVMLLAFLALAIYRIYDKHDCTDFIKKSPNLCFEGFLTLLLFWFFLHGVWPATTNILSLRTWYLLLSHHSPALFPMYGQLASFTLFCLYVSLFSSSFEARKIFLKGVYVGLWCSIPFVLLQIFGVSLPHIPEEGPFWQFLKRHSGLFEDPNAFGVVVGLILFIGMQYRWYLLCFFLTILAFFSGSRLFTLSFLMFLVVYSAHLSLRVAQDWKIGWFKLIQRSSVFLLFGVVFCCITYFYLYKIDQLPDAVQRGLSPLNLVRVYETFSTRAVFWTLGLQMWTDNLLTGIGFGNFERMMTSYAKRNGDDLNLWIDTPNSRKTLDL